MPLHPEVQEVLIVGRKHYELKHPKLKECVVKDFFHLEEVSDQLKGYDACFYCAGISSAGMKEQAYSFITYDTTLHFAGKVLSLNPSMIFCHISGSHTNEHSKLCGHV